MAEPAGSPSQPNTPGVVLHIGLHKTGTRFFQRRILRPLNGDPLQVNPSPLWPAIRNAVRHPDDRAAREVAREAVQAWRDSGDTRTLVLSEPHISGDMYGNHHDHAANTRLMRELFPEARIIYFVRNQADWLQSAYRQQLVKGGSVPMHVFLNHYDGEFRPRLDRWTHGARTVEALKQRFLAIYDDYAQTFGPERVYLFRQEDLKARPEAVRTRLAEALGLDELTPDTESRRENRSYSALAIRLFHPRTNRTMPAPRPRDAGMPARPLRPVTAPLRRLRRLLIQHAFDRIIYRDWDLLAHADMRARIDAHYAEENERIRAIAADVLDHGPGAQPHRTAGGAMETPASAGEGERPAQEQSDLR